MSDELKALARSLGDAAGRILAVQQENEWITAIVRDLAASDPAGEDFGAGPECVLCPANNLPADRGPSLDDHDPSCPWRRAVEWISRDTDQEAT